MLSWQRGYAPSRCEHSPPHPVPTPRRHKSAAIGSSRHLLCRRPLGSPRSCCFLWRRWRVIKDRVVRSIVPYECFGLNCRSCRCVLCFCFYRCHTSDLGSLPCGGQCVKGIDLLSSRVSTIYQSSRHTEPTPYRLANFTRRALLYHAQHITTITASWHCSAQNCSKIEGDFIWGTLQSPELDSVKIL